MLLQNLDYITKAVSNYFLKVTLARKLYLPEDDPWIETCRSNFSVLI